MKEKGKGCRGEELERNGGKREKYREKEGSQREKCSERGKGKIERQQGGERIIEAKGRYRSL